MFELLVVVSSGIWASGTDLKSQRIPNYLILILLVLGLLHNVLVALLSDFPWQSSGTGSILSRCASSVGIFLVGFFLSQVWKKSMGMGDVKLLAVWALFLGPLVVLLGLWLASLIGIGFFLFFRRRSLSSRLAFAPFLTVGTLVAFLLRGTVLSVLGFS